MPRRPNIPCKHPGCNRLIQPGIKYCEEHTALHKADVKTTSEKGYDSRWRKARSRFPKSTPFVREVSGTR